MANTKETTLVEAAVEESTSEVCGLYVIGEPDTIVEITMKHYDVNCATGGLMAVSKWPNPKQKQNKLEESDDKKIAKSCIDEVDKLFAKLNFRQRLMQFAIFMSAFTIHFSHLQFVDGWELNGEYFPGIKDHHRELEERVIEFCNNYKQWYVFGWSCHKALWQASYNDCNT